MLLAEAAQNSMNLRNSKRARFARVIGASAALLSRRIVEVKRNTRAVVQKTAFNINIQSLSKPVNMAELTG